ncbi:MAG: CotH kinase family protein [Planctomycetota bacterium]|nr:CotH kinase family protein [Planctomycetota bacterium]
MDRRLNPLLAVVAVIFSWGCAVGCRAEDGDTATRPQKPSVFRLNELLASNRTGRVDDQGRSSDWVEIYNPTAQAQVLKGYRLTDDLRVLDKWPFPAVRVASRGYQLVWMSGSERVDPHGPARRTAHALLPFDVVLVESGAQWKYFAARRQPQPSISQDRIEGWTQLQYDDSLFQVGRPGFGYGDEDDRTRLPAETTVVLLRREFIWPADLDPAGLVLQVDYDDGFAAYLNGTRVAAANAPPDEPGLESLATGSREAGAPQRFDLSAHAELLREGKNLLAIAGLNVGSGSSDLSIHPVLGTLAPLCHANFRLKRKGGTLYLVNPDGSLADQIEYPRQVSDQSLGRSLGEETDWGYFLTPTPAAANRGPQQAQPVRCRIAFVPQPGTYQPGVSVQLQRTASAAVDIRFTQDGSQPNADSPLYRTGVVIQKTTLFRAAGFVGRERVSPVVAGTYLLRPPRGLPVLSLSLLPEDFTDVHLQRSGQGRKSERSAFLELFDRTGRREVATGFGLRLHGGAGRRGGLETKKSYRAYFRRSYGARRLKHAVIPEAGVEQFDKLVLRANFNDGREHGSYIRDQVIRDLHREMGALTSSGSWYKVLINGESHGVYNVVERMDQEFCRAHLGPGEYDVIKTSDTVLDGTRQGWDELRDFISTRDFSVEDNYRELASRVDIENFTSYAILNLWAQNYDWPHNNWYAARRVPDGKWIFLCWDAEWGLGGGSYGHDVDAYAFIDSGGAYGHGMSRALFFALISNSGYCEYYQQEVRRHLRGALRTDNVLRVVHRHRDAIAADIEHEFESRGNDKRRWRHQIGNIERFLEKSGEHFQRCTEQYFAYRLSIGSQDRAALFEDAERRRHVIYRAPDGQLHQLSSAPSDNSWRDETLGLPGTAPIASGRPNVYRVANSGHRILYRGPAGHLHELSSVSAEKDLSRWQHINLTALLKQPVATRDPSVVVVKGMPHIVYVDRMCRVHELWYDGSWRHGQLPAAPRPAAEVVLSYAASALHVTYRTMFGAVCEQRLLLRDAEEGRRRWSHRLVFGSPAKGTPLGFSPQEIRHILFRGAEKWPLREPFVSGVKTVRARERRIPRGALVHAWYDGDRFWHLEPVEPVANGVAGDPCVIHNLETTRYHFAYRDTQNHIRESTFRSEKRAQGGSWQVIDLMSITGAPAASGDPAGLVSAATGARYYVYRGQDGQMHELRFDGSWSHRDLTLAAQTRGN